MVKRIIILVFLLSISVVYSNPNEFNIFKFIGGIIEIPGYEEALIKTIDETKIIIGNATSYNDIVGLKNQAIELLKSMAPVAYHELQGIMPELFTIKTYWDKYGRESVPYNNQGKLILADNKEAIIILYIDFFNNNREYKYKNMKLISANEQIDLLINKITDIQLKDLEEFISSNKFLIEEAYDASNLEKVNEYIQILIEKMIPFFYKEMISNSPDIFLKFKPYKVTVQLSKNKELSNFLSKYPKYTYDKTTGQLTFIGRMSYLEKEELQKIFSASKMEKIIPLEIKNAVNTEKDDIELIERMFAESLQRNHPPEVNTKNMYLNLENDKKQIILRFENFIKVNPNYKYKNIVLSQAIESYNYAWQILLEINIFKQAEDSKDIRVYKKFIETFPSSRKVNRINKLVKEREESLLIQLKKLSGNHIEEKYIIYQELSESFPTNDLYLSRKNYYISKKQEVDNKIDKRFNEIKRTLSSGLNRYHTIHNIIDSLGEPVRSTYQNGIYGSGGQATWLTDDGHYIEMIFKNYDLLKYVLLDGKFIISFE